MYMFVFSKQAVLYVCMYEQEQNPSANVSTF